MNRLGEETSPYLLQHKENPVNWYPWGEEALAEARRRNVPVLLSIGYAACHWCHVMAHESFEDIETARLMNDLFVNVKVDREERPDIDQIYMAALHALGEQGGWPLTMFLTPDGEPVWGGTYFPPASRYGRPGFRDVLQAIAALFRDGSERLASNRAALMQHLRTPPQSRSSMGRGLTKEDLDAVTRQLASLVDPVNGGPKGAPKFPNGAFLELLWRGASRLRDGQTLQLMLLTLERICLGGIHDHLGGGFARYSVDERWLVPHFEKMLYDNAQLLELLVLGHHETGSELFAEAAQGVVSWLKREMMAGDGRAFAASLDADSEGEEGRFYVWTKAEIEGVLSPDDAALFCRLYDVSEGGNWEGRSIPNRLDTHPPTVADQSRLAAIRKTLLKAREQRIRPGRDDKVLADWNGLMIAALVRAGVHFDRPDWIETAKNAFAFICEAMQRDGRLGHSWRDSKLLFPGFSSDYAAMIRAALALYEALGEPSFLARALSWAKLCETYHFDAQAGFYALTASDATGLIVRPRTTLDEAIPNPNAILAESFVRLAAASGDDAWLARADHMLEALSGPIASNVFGHAGLLNALDTRLTCASITINGSGLGAEALRQAALALPFPTRSVVCSNGGETIAAILCVGGRCSLPLQSPTELTATHHAMRG